MKAYLITTGSLFGLMALLHLWRAMADLPNLKSNPVEFLSMAALGALAAALSVWAWRLFRTPKAN
jgi:hypothetical protein